MSLIGFDAVGANVAACRSMFRKSAWLILLLLVSSSGALLRGESIEVKLVNGQNGLPVAHTCIDLGVDHVDHMLAIPTDKDGVARFSMTDNAVEMSTQKHWEKCGSWGVIDPIVQYTDTFGIHVGYVLCQFAKPDQSWLARMKFSTKEVLQHGIVMANTCGKVTASPKPGEVILFVRPLNLWEKLKQ
jgi:hypothetical protein